MRARRAGILVVAVVGGTLALTTPAHAAASCVGQLGRVGAVPGADAREIRGPGLGNVVRIVAAAHRDCAAVLPPAP